MASRGCLNRAVKQKGYIQARNGAWGMTKVTPHMSSVSIMSKGRWISEQEKRVKGGNRNSPFPAMGCVSWTGEETQRKDL